jgi:hypothetical protein
MVMAQTRKYYLKKQLFDLEVKGSVVNNRSPTRQMQVEISGSE